MGNQNKRAKLTKDDQFRLSQGKVVNVKSGIKIKVNPQTGKLEGVPQQWAQDYDLPIDIDESKVVKTKHLYKQIRPQYQIPESILQAINNQPIPVSKPKNFVHVMHLQADFNAQYGIKGLPQEWKQRFIKQNISSEEVRANPTAMIEVIQFMETEQKVPQNKLLSDLDFQKILSEIKVNTNMINKDYKMTRTLGKGAMCVVYYATSKLDPTKEVAVRRMKVEDTEELRKIKIQIAVMAICANPNIVNYIDCYQIEKVFFMVIEYMNGGSLYDFITAYNKTIPDRVVSFIMREILRGLLPIHLHKQIHRDMKPDNVLINSQGDVKVADFGFAIQLTKERQNRKSMFGTPAWMAPELIKLEEYTQLVDVWSTGIIAVELVEGDAPFVNLAPGKAIFFIKTKDAYRLNPTKYPKQLCHFVACCLQKDISKRWSIAKLLQHPYITRIGQAIQQKKQFAQMVQNMKNNDGLVVP